MSDKDVARQALEQVQDADKEKRISLYREHFKKLLMAIEEDKKTIAEANRRKQIREKMVDYLKAGQLDKALELQEELQPAEKACMPITVAPWLDSNPSNPIGANGSSSLPYAYYTATCGNSVVTMSLGDFRNGSTGAFNIGSRTIII